MRRIRNWLRSTLAILNIESNLTAELNPDDIVSNLQMINAV